MKIRIFKFNINSEIQGHLNLCEPKIVDEAMNITLQYEQNVLKKKDNYVHMVNYAGSYSRYKPDNYDKNYNSKHKPYYKKSYRNKKYWKRRNQNQNNENKSNDNSNDGY